MLCFMSQPAPLASPSRACCDGWCNGLAAPAAAATAATDANGCWAWCWWWWWSSFCLRWYMLLWLFRLLSVRKTLWHRLQTALFNGCRCCCSLCRFRVSFVLSNLPQTSHRWQAVSGSGSANRFAPPPPEWFKSDGDDGRPVLIPAIITTPTSSSSGECACVSQPSDHRYIRVCNSYCVIAIDRIDLQHHREKKRETIVTY